MSQLGVVEEPLVDGGEEELVNGFSRAALQTVNDQGDDNENVAETVEDTVLEDFDRGPLAGLRGSRHIADGRCGLKGKSCEHLFGFSSTEQVVACHHEKMSGRLGKFAEIAGKIDDDKRFYEWLYSLHRSWKIWACKFGKRCTWLNG